MSSVQSTSSKSGTGPTGGSRGVKRARAINTKGEGGGSNKDELPKKVKKRIKTSSTSGVSLVLTKSSKPSSVTARKPSADSPSVETVRPTPVATLGSLPLHGEELPAGNYSDVPGSTKATCDQIRDVLTKVKELKEDPKAKTEIDGQKQRGLVLFSYLKKLNRLSHLYCKDSREQTHEQKLEVDDLHLQLQNLMYEAMHLRKEITNCLEFKSQHEEIDLVSEEEMRTVAPESVSKPEMGQDDEHQKMLSRLQWEMEERKSLAKQKGNLEEDIKKLESEISQKEGHLNSLLPSLEELRKATLPLQESLGIPLDRNKEEQELALLLPRALYVVFTQAKAYAEVQDSSLSVSIEGDMGEARSFLGNKDKEPSDDESGDSDGEGKEEGSRRKKRHKRSKSNREKKDISKAYPLAVCLTFTIKELGSLQITLNYLHHFSAACASVTSLNLHGILDSNLSPLLERSSLLHCLTEGDTGRTSPNSIVSLNIRKHSGDVFSSAVRQYGFPYKWVQKVCGIDDQSDSSTQSMPSASQEFNWLNDSQMELSAECLETVVKALKTRFRSQAYLVKQIMSLSEDDHKLVLGPDDVQLFQGTPKSQLTKWKSLSSPEVKTFQSSFASISILNQQERTNKFFLSTYQLDQARLYGLVCVGVDYPATPPCFAVMVESDGTKEPGTIHTKNIEAEINIRFPQSIHGDKYGRYLLCRQIRRLQECFELYMDHRQSPDRISKLLSKARGKGRLLKLSDST